MNSTSRTGLGFGVHRLSAFFSPSFPSSCSVVAGQFVLQPDVTGYYDTADVDPDPRSHRHHQRTGLPTRCLKPTAEDLVPNELQYRLAPGDVVRVEIYELVAANQTTSQFVIDQSGAGRLRGRSAMSRPRVGRSSCRRSSRP